MHPAFKKLFQFYLFGNIHIALCAVACVYTFGAIVGAGSEYPILIIAFSGTLALYSFQRLVGVIKKENDHIHSERHEWNIHHKNSLIVLTLISCLAGSWAFFQISMPSQILLIVLGFISFIYAAPVFPAAEKKLRLRDFPFVKVFFIAIIWTGVSVWLPLLNGNAIALKYNPNILASGFYTSLVFFPAVLALTIPFDLRDMSSDPPEIRSLPMILGEKKSILLCQILVLISVAMALGGYQVEGVHHFSYGQCISYAVWALITLISLQFCHSKRHEYYFSFLMDGLLLLLCLLLSGKDLIEG
jgi:4-hydroxybenzoate polyprenyltransferase